MRAYKILGILSISLLATVYGLLLAILSVIFGELTPFIGGLIVMVIGAVPLYLHSDTLETLGRDIF